MLIGHWSYRSQPTEIMVPKMIGKRSQLRNNRVLAEERHNLNRIASSTKHHLVPSLQELYLQSYSTHHFHSLFHPYRKRYRSFKVMSGPYRKTQGTQLLQTISPFSNFLQWLFDWTGDTSSFFLTNVPAHFVLSDWPSPAVQRWLMPSHKWDSHGTTCLSFSSINTSTSQVHFLLCVQSSGHFKVMYVHFIESGGVNCSCEG